MATSEAVPVFATPWFQLVSRTGGPYTAEAPHYSLRCADYVTAIAQTREGKLVMVRQFRPAVQERTLEFPSGHLEKGESPLESAARELLEETGYLAGEGKILGCLRPDTGRLGNRLWVDLFPKAEFVGRQTLDAFEEGLEVVEMPVPELLESTLNGSFSHALNLAPFLLALQSREIGFSINPLQE